MTIFLNLFIIAWVIAYKLSIQHIRSSGWKGIILVDATAYAQDPTG
jgi:hypothetical protein